jgi:hypothetical protein
LHGMQEVGGSIPPGSTSLRWLRQLRLGKPCRGEGCHAEARRAQADAHHANSVVAKKRLRRPQATAMKYVYILETEDTEHFYVGLTDNLRARLARSDI